LALVRGPVNPDARRLDIHAREVAAGAVAISSLDDDILFGLVYLGRFVNTRLPTTAFVVLGLVSLRSTTGHDLAAFAERSIGQFFSLTRSHVYSELDRLCRMGLLDVTEVEQERFPTKRVYEITPEGLKVLEGWLGDADMPAERQRNMFLVQVFFGDRMSDERLEELLARYEVRTRERRERLAEVVERLADRPESVFRRATAMFGAAQAQASLDWIDEVRPMLLAACCADRDRC
jgi:PadR family transcriptional regulator AphA